MVDGGEPGVDSRDEGKHMIIHKHAPNTNNLMEVMVQSRFTGSG